MSHVLLVDDDAAIRALLCDALGDAGYTITAVGNSDEALKAVRKSPVDCAILDLNLPGIDGVALMKSLREIQPGLQAVVITGDRSVDAAVGAMKAGAFDYFTKPLDLDRLAFALRNIIAAAEKDREIQRLRDEVVRAAGFGSLVTESAPMKRAVELARRVATSEAPVLLTGESGTGKELFARAIHAASGRRGRVFVAINCGAIPPTLAESELFGHEPGAFTGATSRRSGRFEEAHGGTLFLDEIEAMPLDVQAKILRVLQERVASRVGSSKTFPADARVIAASNRDLEAMIREGKFREDLYFRIAVVSIQLPPLRERPEDLPILAARLVQEAAAREGRAIRGVKPDAMMAMAQYRWPGNVRELLNSMTHAVLACDGGEIGAEHLPPRLARPSEGDGGAQTLDGAVEALERWLIGDALKRAGGVQAKAAELLGTTKRIIGYKIQKYGLGKAEEP